ncbi:hypothetical protein V6N13_092023 [Hibiscus sabdariffa]
MVIGDFNATISLYDRLDCSSNSPEPAFQDMVFNCVLHDLGYSGPDFTWYRGNCSVRLDRCFGNALWWSLHLDFKRLVRDNWDSSIPIIEAVNNFSIATKKWNTEVFGVIVRNKKILMARLRGVQRFLDKRRTQSMLKLELKLLEEIEQLLDQEEML